MDNLGTQQNMGGMPQQASPAPAVAPTTPAPVAMTMENGGGMPSTSPSTNDGSFFKSLNWLEVAFGILGVASLTYVIFYYRFKLKQDKLINNDLQRQIDEVKMNVQGLMKNKYKTI